MQKPRPIQMKIWTMLVNCATGYSIRYKANPRKVMQALDLAIKTRAQRNMDVPADERVLAPGMCMP